MKPKMYGTDYRVGYFVREWNLVPYAVVELKPSNIYKTEMQRKMD
jgi:hypothetical protein